MSCPGAHRRLMVVSGPLLYLEALFIWKETIAPMLSGSLDRLRLRLRRGVPPGRALHLSKFRKKDPRGVPGDSGPTRRFPSSSARHMGCRVWRTSIFESLVITTLEWLDRDWGPHECTFLDAGRQTQPSKGRLEEPGKGMLMRCVLLRRWVGGHSEGQAGPILRSERVHARARRNVLARCGRTRSVALVDTLGSAELVRASFVIEGRSALGPRLALSWRKGEDHKWSILEGWHDSPIVRCGWPGWKAPGHGAPRRGEVMIAGGLPSKGWRPSAQWYEFLETGWGLSRPYRQPSCTPCPYTEPLSNLSFLVSVLGCDP
ncbi:hypothetical protein CRG98_025874 [Punica granatum]|uniref:Uncharacterized protein n=1 Tax=Punica granatum TaxID=22663 RepID=A0A2I0JC00_PUNGR|nr:hypothetical protein CRG98_025874 [Punica granatum]